MPILPECPCSALFSLGVLTYTSARLHHNHQHRNPNHNGHRYHNYNNRNNHDDLYYHHHTSHHDHRMMIPTSLRPFDRQFLQRGGQGMFPAPQCAATPF